MRRRLIGELVATAALALLLLANHWLFARWLDASYVRWYVESGPWIGVATRLTADVWPDLEEHDGLVSASPREYCGSWVGVVGATFVSFGMKLPPVRSGRGLGRAVDVVLASLVTAGVVLGLIGWLLVVVPAQYAVYALCGAPSRIFRDSPHVAAWNVRDTRAGVNAVPAGGTLPPGWWADGLARKPLAVTATFATVLLLLARGALA